MGMLSQQPVHVALSSGVASASFQPIGLGVSHVNHPHLGFVKEEIVGPFHFVLDQEELFCPAIPQSFGPQPMNPVNCVTNEPAPQTERHDSHSVIQSLLAESPSTSKDQNQARVLFL